MPIEDLICTGNDIFKAASNNQKARTGAEIKAIIKDTIENKKYTKIITEDMVKDFADEYLHRTNYTICDNSHYILCMDRHQERLYVRRIFD